jgi:hypothetical protein
MCHFCGEDHPVPISPVDAVDLKLRIIRDMGRTKDWNHGPSKETIANLAASDVTIASSDCWNLVVHALDSFDDEPFDIDYLIADNVMMVANVALPVIIDGNKALVSVIWWYLCPYNDDLMHVSLFWQREDSRGIKNVNIFHDDIPSGEFATQIKFIQVYNRLALQKIIKQEVTSPTNRETRRRMGKLARNAKTDVVTIILRQIETQKAEGESQIEWQHRWLVRGHWRKQWLPSVHGHRQQWIAPYVKGPEDKPLVIKPRVFDFRRRR